MNLVTVLTEQEKDSFKSIAYFLSLWDREHLTKEATPYAYETHIVENAQGWTIKPVDKGSIDNLIIGDLTGCCQKLGGWGDGWDDEHNINYGITDAFCDWMVNFTGTMTSVKNHEPKGFYRYLDNKHEKAFFFPSYFCQTVPVAHDEKWCYDHDEYLKKARAVRGPVDEPCDPYEWDDEYDDL